MSRTLIVKIIMADLKFNYDINDNEEPYCKIKLGEIFYNTSNQNKNHENIKKNEEFTFEIINDNILEVFLINNKENKDILGKGEINILEIDNFYNELKLLDKEKKIIGTLKLNLNIINIKEKNNKDENKIDDEIKLLIKRLNKSYQNNLSLKNNINIIENEINNTINNMKEKKYNKIIITEDEILIKKEIENFSKKNNKLKKEIIKHKLVYNNENNLSRLESLEYKKNLINKKISQLNLEKKYNENNMNILKDEIIENKNENNLKLIMDDINKNINQNKEKIKKIKQIVFKKDLNLKELNEIFIQLEKIYRHICNNYNIDNVLNIDPKSNNLFKPLVLNKLRINKSQLFKKNNKNNNELIANENNYKILINKWKEIWEKKESLKKDYKNKLLNFIKIKNKNESLLKDLKLKEGIKFLLNNKLKEIKFLKKKNNKKFNIKKLKKTNTKSYLENKNEIKINSTNNIYNTNNKEEIYILNLDEKELKDIDIDSIKKINKNIEVNEDSLNFEKKIEEKIEINVSEEENKEILSEKEVEKNIDENKTKVKIILKLKKKK